MGSWSLVTRLQLQSLNVLLRWKTNGQTWRYAKQRDLWRRLFADWQLAQRIPEATNRRRLRIVRVYAGRQRAFDADNLGVKPVIDSMKPTRSVAYGHKVSSGGLLIDDNAAGVVLELDQRRGEIAGTEITLEDA